METGPATTSISGADLRMGLRLGSAFQNLLAPLVLLDVDLASGEPLLEDRERLPRPRPLAVAPERPDPDGDEAAQKTRCRSSSDLKTRILLPGELQLPPGVDIPFQWVRIRGDRAFVSGHGPLNPEGTPAGPFGKVPSEVSLEDAQESARLAALAILASLKRALGDLDRVAAWLTVNGFVNADPGYPHTTLVLNPFSDLISACTGLT